MDEIVKALVVVIVCYLMGSIPTAYLLAKTRNVNIFEIGSGNMGGTNLSRVMGLGWGLLNAAIDIFKGVLAVYLAREVLMPEAKGAATTIGAVAVIAGHNWSLFATLLTATVQNGRVRLIIRGGKGAATAFGTMIVIAPLHILVAMVALGGFIVARTRLVSLGVLVAFGLGLVWLAALAGMNQLPREIILYTLLLAVLIVVRFRENIQRLVNGKERRLGDSA